MRALLSLNGKNKTSAAVKPVRDELFLPNFCGVRMVLALMVIAQLLAFALALGQLDSNNRWQDLSLISLFIQWTALSSGAVLCFSRPWLRKLPNIQAGLLSYVLLLAVTAAMSEAVYWIMQSTVMDAQISRNWYYDFLLRNLAISAIVSAVALRYFYVQHQWKRNIESEAQARIQALQSRIRPHFLFNSLNSIASLTRSHPHQAESAVMDLADLFRGSLREARLRVPLSEEFDLCHKYLRIEKLRLGERLSLRWETSELPQDALLPALTLQPLLENAIYHGIEPLACGGEIVISGTLQQNMIHVSISNPLGTDTGRPTGNRIAVDNVRQRLQAFYGERGELIAENVSPQLHVVHLRFPYLHKES